MSKQKLKVFSLVIFFGIIIFPFFVGAAGLVPCGGSEGPCTICHLIVGIKGLIDFGKNLLITAAVVGIFISGVLYIISSGSQTMMTQAKNFLTASVTGFALVLLAWFIVNVTIYWVSAAKPDLGVGATNWYTFSCDTTSSALDQAPGGGGGQPGAKCCVKTNNPEDTELYGKADLNCKAPQQVSQSECEDWCANNYAGDEAKINDCKKDCKDTSICNEGDGNIQEGDCNTLPACGAAKPTGDCAPTNNGCGGLGGNTNGCEYTSSNLASKLACIKGKGVGAQIVSVTLNAHSDWCEKCVKTYSGADYCKHSKSSCHFGGRNCGGTSSGVDLNPSDAVAQAAMDCGFDTVIWQGKELRTGKSASDHTDHVHASVDNKSCGCDYQK